MLLVVFMVDVNLTAVVTARVVLVSGSVGRTRRTCGCVVASAACSFASVTLDITQPVYQNSLAVVQGQLVAFGCATIRCARIHTLGLRRLPCTVRVGAFLRCDNTSVNHCSAWWQ